MGSQSPHARFPWLAFAALVVGLALLTQTAMAVPAGWLVFDETLGAQDGLGMILLAAARGCPPLRI